MPSAPTLTAFVSLAIPSPSDDRWVCVFVLDTVLSTQGKLEGESSTSFAHADQVD
jgi:hypothetical protein